MSDFRCVDCGKDTSGHEYYMLHDHVWEATGLGPKDGMLCIEHLEARLGRQITIADLALAPINLLTGIADFIIERAMRPQQV